MRPPYYLTDTAYLFYGVVLAIFKVQRCTTTLAVVIEHRLPAEGPLV